MDQEKQKRGGGCFCSPLFWHSYTPRKHSYKDCRPARPGPAALFTELCEPKTQCQALPFPLAFSNCLILQMLSYAGMHTGSLLERPKFSNPLYENRQRREAIKKNRFQWVLKRGGDWRIIKWDIWECHFKYRMLFSVPFFKMSQISFDVKLVFSELLLRIDSHPFLRIAKTLTQ